MLVQVKQLLYWKTEHGNADNCQDAPFHNAEQGLFAVADGAGTSLFPALWARILAQHFVTTPLMSDDPFEVEWWVRLAQTEYKQKMPAIHKAGAWNIVQKVRNQGSDSTLATLRITRVGAETAEAMLLVFGDSCVLRGDQGKETVSSFILQQPNEFDRAPICVPSDLKYFNRDFHRCQISNVTLNSGDQIIIATDAVSRWILGQGEIAGVWEAFQEVYQCPSLDDWYTLVDTKRQRKEMINDDSTALVLTFYNDAAEIGTPLGCVNQHTEEVITQRKDDFETAARSDNKELLAIAYGDGIDLRSVATTPPIDDIDITYARKVADGLKEVLRVFRLAHNSPDLVQKVKPVWERYSQLLEHESCAANLRETLRNNRIIPTLEHPPAIPPKQIPVPSVPLKPTPAVLPTETPAHIIDTPQGSMLSNAPLRSPDSVMPATTSSNVDPYAETLILPHPLTPAVDIAAQQKQHDLELTLAKKEREVNFLRACEKGNEEEIVAAYEELLKYNDQDTLSHIASPRRLEIDTIRQRRAALANFTGVIQQNAYPDKILNAYLAAREAEPSLSLPQEHQEVITLAQAFVTALNSHDLYALEKAYRNINRSRFGTQIVFTQEVMEKCVQATDFVQKQKEDLQRIIIARLNQRIIPLKSFISVYIIKALYIRYLESLPVSNVPAEAAEQARVIKALRHQLAEEDFPRLVFDEIINSMLIRLEIHLIDASLEQQLRTRRQHLVDELQRFEEKQPDPLFRRQELGTDDLWDFSRTVIAPELLTDYLENQKKGWQRLRPQPKKALLDDWLRDRKEEYKDYIFFGEMEPYAYTDRVKIQTRLKQYVATYIYNFPS
jgi:hypothetical protein